MFSFDWDTDRLTVPVSYLFFSIHTLRSAESLTGRSHPSESSTLSTHLVIFELDLISDNLIPYLTKT